MKPNGVSVTTVATGLALTLAVAFNTTAADLPKGLVLYLNFNEVDNAGAITDRSGQKNAARACNVKWTTGKLGGAYELGPADSYIQVANNPSLNVSQATIAAWFKTSKADAVARRIFDKRTYTVCVSNGKLAFGVGRSWCLSDGTVADDNWHHAAATCDGANLKLYVDGALQKQVTRVFGGIAPNASALTIGNGSNPSAQEQFEGMIDEVMLFNRALAAEEIKALAGAESGGTAAKGKGKTFTKAQVAGRLRQLKDLLDRGLVTQEFYDKKVEELSAAK